MDLRLLGRCDRQIEIGWGPWNYTLIREVGLEPIEDLLEVYANGLSIRKSNMSCKVVCFLDMVLILTFLRKASFKLWVEFPPIGILESILVRR